MAIVIGSNSWISIADADDYLTYRVGAEDWFSLTDVGNPGAESKTTFLVTAFYWLFGSSLLNISKSATDDNVKNAQCEAALYLMSNYTEYFQRRGVLATGLKTIALDMRQEAFDAAQLSIPSYILSMLAEYNISNNFPTLTGEYDV